MSLSNTKTVSNTISQRIYDFLKTYPPFDVLEKEQLIMVSSNITVLYIEPNQTIFSQDEEPHKLFYVVHDGALELKRTINEDQVLLDICDEGDVFGLRPLIQNDHYSMSVKAKEESIIYGIPIDVFRNIIETNVRVRNFILASFSTNLNNQEIKNAMGDVFANENILRKSSFYFDSQMASFSMHPVLCNTQTKIKDAAQVMSDNDVGSIIVENNNKPLGIITNKDLRSKIATGIVSFEEEVSKIMSSPVITVSSKVTVAEAQITMLKYNISHLCVTEMGTEDEEILGVLSEHDLVVLRGDNPSALIKAIDRAKKMEVLISARKKASKLLTQYLNQHTPISFISKIVSEINLAITKKVIAFSLDEMSTSPPVNFAWLALGSQGRSEQLLMTDQDNALIYENNNAQSDIGNKEYFLEFSKKVTKKLNEIGFEFCPADMMASNPRWCLSLEDWKAQFRSWIKTPSEKSIMMCTIFFDYNCLFGESDLVHDISKSIYNAIDSYEIFLNYLARNAIINPPPVGFFRQLVVESDGVHKNEFDLKARALMPLIDAARLLILSHQIEDKINTIERYSALAVLEPQNKDLYESCIDSFKILQRYRTEQGVLNNDSGRYLKLETLSKSEKLRLKGCFKPIKDIQELIMVRFRLSQIM